MKKASSKLFKKLDKNRVQCLACQRYCQIEEGGSGFCQTRVNFKGSLYSLTYGIVSGFQIDPIEKKPLYHFYPGSWVLSFGSYGCNYRCRQCLNYHISWHKPALSVLLELKKQALLKKNSFEIITPAKVVDLALKESLPGIAFTYNEPSLNAEFVAETARLAKKNKLFTIMVTNGSWSREALDYYASYIDSCNIDIKGFSAKTYQKQGAFFGQILKTTELVFKKHKIFVELTTLIIENVNDSSAELKAIASWIAKKLNPEVPWHLSRFEPDLSPDPYFQKLPETSIKTLQRAERIGREAGLKHIYVWAASRKGKEDFYSQENTFCPKCRKLAVKRKNWQVLKNNLQKNRCQKCHYQLYFQA